MERNLSNLLAQVGPERVLVRVPRIPEYNTRRAQERSAELADYKRVRKVVVWKEPLERTSIGKVRRVAYKGKLDE